MANLNDKRSARRVELPDAWLSTDTVRRFWAKVNVGSPDECWHWRASCGGPQYGHMWCDIDGVRCCIDAHRLSWMIANGRVPHGLSILHRCNNRLCVNPNHLYAGTPAQNVHQALRENRIIRTIGGDDAVKIVNERKAGCLLVEIAGRRGLSVNHVRRILTGCIWASVTGIQQQQVTSTKCEQTNFFNLLKGFSHERT